MKLGKPKSSHSPLERSTSPWPSSEGGFTPLEPSSSGKLAHLILVAISIDLGSNFELLPSNLAMTSDTLNLFFNDSKLPNGFGVRLDLEVLANRSEFFNTRLGNALILMWLVKLRGLYFVLLVELTQGLMGRRTVYNW